MVSSVPSNPSSVSGTAHAWGGEQARGEDGDDGVTSKHTSIASTLQAITELAVGVYRTHRTCKDSRKPFALCASSDETVPCITDIHELTPKRAHKVKGKRWRLNCKCMWCRCMRDVSEVLTDIQELLSEHAIDCTNLLHQQVSSAANQAASYSGDPVCRLPPVPELSRLCTSTIVSDIHAARFHSQQSQRTY